MDFLKITRAELDRLIEQSPPIPGSIIEEFEREFSSVPKLKRPDIAHGIDHTRIYSDEEPKVTVIQEEVTPKPVRSAATWYNPSSMRKTFIGTSTAVEAATEAEAKPPTLLELANSDVHDIK